MVGGLLKVTVEKIVNTLLFLYILLKPFYLWSSGLPQIADFILVILIIVAVFKVKFKRNEKIPYIIFTLVSILLLYHVIFVNSIWYIVLGNENSLLFNSLFYIFNVLAMLAVLYLHYDKVESLLKSIYYGVVCSVGIQCILYFIVGGGNLRETIFFNNPNQLAYYALFCLAYLLIVERVLNFRSLIYIFAMLGCLFLIFISASLGALAGAIFMLSVYSFVSRKKGVVRFVTTSITISSLAFLYLLMFDNPLIYRINFLNTFVWRFNNSSVSGEGFIVERAYDRILNHPEYWFFGAGEGDYTRFDSVASYEIHSTLGTMFFSYGIIGFFLFSFMLIYVFHKSRWIYGYPIIAILIYGLTHNGLRNSMLWLMFSLIILVFSIIEGKESEPFNKRAGKSDETVT